MSVSRLGRTFSKKNPSSCFAIDRFAQSLCKWITSEKPTCGDQPVNLPSFWEVQRVAQALNEKICERTNVRE